LFLEFGYSANSPLILRLNANRFLKKSIDFYTHGYHRIHDLFIIGAFLE
jgi:hypothetical protein